MSKEKLIPELRFPEFENEGEWEDGELGNHCEITTGKLDANAMVENGQYRFYTCAKDYYYIDNYAFNTDALLISGNGANVGYIHHYNGKFNAYQRTYILDNFDKDIHYVQYFLERNLKARIASEKKDGNTPYIVRSTLSEMQILSPKNKLEQQKIASCLSSLDELIAAHNDKLDALKDHKKGLLQNLFPQEGETVPKVRFSEFEGDGEWVEKKLNTLSKRVIAKNRNGKFTAVFTNSATDGIVDQRDYFDKDIANKKNLENYFVVQNGDYVYNPRISEHAPVGPLFKNRLGKTGVMSPLYTVFRFNEKNNDFYEYYFQTSHWRNSIRAIANTGARFDRISITASLFMEIPVLYTGLMEQQKIASCLSAVDELITAQQEKIEQLQQYKKGLMQGLFPKIES